jgi:hypothetical protein
MAPLAWVRNAQASCEGEQRTSVPGSQKTPVPRQARATSAAVDLTHSMHPVYTMGWPRRWRWRSGLAWADLVEYTNGEFDDWIVCPDVLDQDLADWSKNKLRQVGELLDVEWLDDEASRHVRDHVSGLKAP